MYIDSVAQGVDTGILFIKIVHVNLSMLAYRLFREVSLYSSGLLFYFL